MKQIWQMQKQLTETISNGHPEEIDIHEFLSSNENFYNGFVEGAFDGMLRFKERQEKDRQLRAELRHKRRSIWDEKPDIEETTGWLFSSFETFLQKGESGALVSEDFLNLGIGRDDWRIVRNTDVVRAFAHVLPSIDPLNAARHYRMGKIVAIFIMFEWLFKACHRRTGDVAAEYDQQDFNGVKDGIAFERLLADYETCNRGIGSS